MPTFLTREQIYRIIQRELPRDTYPDGPPSAFFSTADSDSTAAVAASGYSNLEVIYDNFFPQTSDEKLVDWEIKVFGKASDSSLSDDERKSRVLAKLRERKNMAMWTILTTVLGYVPEGTFVQIYERCQFEGGWFLDESLLDFDAFLNPFFKIVLGEGRSYCSPTFDEWTLDESGLDEETLLAFDDIYRVYGFIDGRDWGEQQMNAYTYEVRIFDYTLPAGTAVELAEQLNALEPARSWRFLIDNQDLADYHLTEVVPNVSLLDNVNCVKVDPTATTGFTGRRVE